MKIKVLVKNEYIEFNSENNITAQELLKLFETNYPYPIYGCKVDNCYRGLPHLIHHDCTVEFLDIRTTAIWHVYQNSLVLLFLNAIHHILGENVRIEVNNSLNKGLFITVKSELTNDNVKAISDYMSELVKKDLPIVKQHMNKKQAIELAKSLKQTNTQALLESIDTIKNVEIYSLENETAIFYNFLVPSTGYLKYFELEKYRNGVILRFPHQSDPVSIPTNQDQKLLYGAYAKAKEWSNIMHTNYLVDLNKIINDHQVNDIYLMQEAFHEKNIAEIADSIKTSGKRVVLICGPSSSGKTTFAKRLCIQLNVNGLSTLYLGTDDYFVNRDQTPLDENGEKDYENITCVDCKLFVNNLNDLLAGKTVDLPRYDFINGEKVFGERFTSLNKNQIIVIEGIHSLNRILTDGVDDNEKFKIYISPFTSINIDNHNRIPATDLRLLRRMIRDNRTRAMDAATTIASWPKVRKGEEKNIFPFNGEADVFFNSNCIYELSVIKKYAEPLLLAITRDKPEYAEAQRLLSFLRFFKECEDEKCILNNSIIREFIGNSVIV